MQKIGAAVYQQTEPPPPPSGTEAPAGEAPESEAPGGEEGTVEGEFREV